MKIDTNISADDVAKQLPQVFELAGAKCRSIEDSWDRARGTPVFTVDGKYTSRGWTEWTQGFQYGCCLLTFDAIDDAELLEIGRRNTVERMAPHLTHTGVHDHGFNNLSTYGNLRRLMKESRIAHDEWQMRFYELALKASGAVQAARWAGIRVDKPSPHAANSAALGYISSFNGKQSLFVDTMRTTRSLGVAWQLGHVLMHENDRTADLLKRAVLHALATKLYIVFHGDSSHAYDVRGRTAHEAIFNREDGLFRCRSTQQGYSPFSTWTRGLAWAMLGFAEQLEFLRIIPDEVFRTSTSLEKSVVVRVYEQAAKETCDHYINDCSAADGIVYWDDGAPNLHKLGDWRNRDAEPFNDHEPVDSSASAIAAQGLMRLGNYLGNAGNSYRHAAMTIAKRLFDEPYLSRSAQHQGLLLHSVYHRPNGWDHVPPPRKIPCGESSMWGDYHLLELAVLLQRMSTARPYLTFFDPAISRPLSQ